MSRLVMPRRSEAERHPDDVDRMERVLADAGHTASRADLVAAWEQHSEGWCASWLSIDDGEDADLRLLATLTGILVPEDEA